MRSPGPPDHHVTSRHAARDQPVPRHQDQDEKDSIIVSGYVRVGRTAIADDWLWQKLYHSDSRINFSHFLQSAEVNTAGLKRGLAYFRHDFAVGR